MATSAADSARFVLAQALDSSDAELAGDPAARAARQASARPSTYSPSPGAQSGVDRTLERGEAELPLKARGDPP